MNERSKSLARRRRAQYNPRNSSDKGKDRWVLSYADFITLLFAFFVALYSISLDKAGDERLLTETLNGVFDAVQKSVKPINIGEPIVGEPDGEEILEVDPENAEESISKGEEGSPDNSTPSQIYDLLNEVISSQFASLTQSGKVSISENDSWISLELKSGLLFGEGEYELTNEAVALLIVISNILNSYPSPVLVEGNTDDQPIARAAPFSSNWSLSSLRASAVVDELVFRGVSPKLIAPIGFSSEHPKVRNRNDESRAQNRRVTLKISKLRTDNLYDYLFN
ncbi:OmpA family protein [Marinomonas balearica]|uniref:Chemotaxis protein MotB n=1 Tax=Marinomonas balearica TaxID=491947 RepID=A0A4R6MA40_9GAMM|nr:OmpA family protein [Marinomonas balearica]TDO98313.1 chemotaxis protein MotB [Marinomonas balearica]